MENTGETSGVPKMENLSVVLGKQNGGTASSATPAFYVLVKQNTGKSDQGACISNQIDCGLTSSASTPVKSKVKSYLPADCTSGSVTVTLDNNNMWNEFYHRSTEMILTKQGRRMFPYCRYWIAGLESNLKYILVMDISPVDNFRYKWNGHSWEPSGKAEPHVLGRVFIHPESPSTGYYWMHQPVSFYKLKLTNNTLDQEGHIILHSMHRYLPRLHLIPADKATDVIQLNGPDVHTFTFSQTEFFAVTAYQNIQITQLKIDYNPFAKGFREDGLSSRVQRDVKQNSSSEQEESSVANSPSNHRHSSEGDTFSPEQRSLDTSFNGICNTDIERESLSPYHDLLDFVETDTCMSHDPLLKQEASESPVDIPYRSISQADSPLSTNGDVSVIKEEPVDDYDYEPNKVTDGISVKQEDVDNVTEEYSSSGDSILEQKLKKHKKKEEKETEITSRKRLQTSQLGVAKAKMLKSDTRKMPVVYLEPCAVTRNTVTVSGVSQPMLSSSKSEKSSSHSMDSFPNSSICSSLAKPETDERPNGNQTSESNMLQKNSSKKAQQENTETSSSIATTNRFSSCNLKSITCSAPFPSKAVSGGEKTSALKKHISHKSVIGVQHVELSGPRKRGRPRKIKHPGVGRPPKYAGKPIVTRTYASLCLDSTSLDIKPDLVDVDGVLFVSFASKEALDIHTVDRCEEKESQNTQTPSVVVGDRCSDQEIIKIQKLEKELLEDLKSFKYKQVIHPSLQEVGLKLNFVDPTMSIDLKYLGVQLPLSYSDDCTMWKNLGTGSISIDAGLPFVSRTGKTNDFTKIKGWQGKLHNSSKNEGIILEGSLKNRSAFCSDKLDEYLENEGKLLETSMGLSPSTSSCPVVYQLPTKSTSYVRTLDSVLKKQSTITASGCYGFKPLSMPSDSKKKRERVKNKKQTISKGKEKLFSKPVITLPVVSKQKRTLSVLEEKVTKVQTGSQGSNDVGTSMVPGTEENLPGKHTAVRQSQQPLQQSSRLPCLSKTQLKLMNVEDYALWSGKPRTYITEERADLSLAALLTAQASLKNKPIHKIIKWRTPPCNNDFCRLGCVCSSLALEKHQPTHCRKTDCMFGCTCLKRKVVLIKGDSKHKKMLKKPQHGKHKLHCGEKLEKQEEILEKAKEQDDLKIKDKKKKKKKMEYTVCDTEPEKPVKNFPLWVKEDGEMDPEPVYIPTPSTSEPTKPTVPPILEVLCDNKPADSDIRLLTNGVKSPRVHTPRTTPVIREEDKDPIYLYFESMMTCARVRMYDRKTQEKNQHQKCLSDNEKSIEKECDSEPQSDKTEKDKEPESRTKTEEDKEPEEENWWFSCSAEDPSTSYVHHTTPGGRTNLIEIVSECNWEEDRSEILTILSQHINNRMPKSFKVGNFTIDLESESNTWDEKNAAIHSSRVKISMPSCQNKSEMAQISVLEAPNDRLSSCKRREQINLLTPGMLREHRKKGLPFYAGLSPAGKLIAHTCKSDLDPSCLIQVNGKNYPQAKLLLGQMGALHPTSRLAAYLTGRLRPAMLDLSTISMVISKVASSAKCTGSEPKSTEVPTSETSKTTFSNSTSNSTVTGPNVRVTAHRQIAARPSTEGVTSQLVVSAVGALQQKIPGIRTPQPLTGPQIFNIKSSPLSFGTNVVTTTMPSVPITIPSLSPCNNATSSSGIAIMNALGKPENTTGSATPTTATVKITKSTEIAAPVATIAFAKSVVATSTPGSSASLCTVIPVTASTDTVTTPPSPVACGGPGPSGISLSNQKPGTTSPPGLPPGAEKRMGPRLLLIPVHPGSPTLRPPQNMQLGQGKRMILQPIRNPGGANLYRHPNGQIIQLVPLHQLQPAGSQPSSQTVMFRNPGSVVGIRLPEPSKTSETPICQPSAVSSVISTTLTPTTPVLSATTSSPPTSTEATTILSETLTTSVSSVLPSTPCKDFPLISLPPAVLPTPPAVETSSTLSVLSSISTPLLTVSPSAAPVLPTAKTQSASPSAFAPSVLPVSCSAVSVSSLIDAPSTLPKPATTEGSSVLSVFSTAEMFMKVAEPSSTSPLISETTSVSPTHPTISCTSETIRSAPELPISVSQAVSVMPPAFVPVSQAGTLTLRISPSGIRSMNSDYKITCSKSEQPNSKDNLISLHSGSFALLQFPEQNNAPSSIVKQTVSLQVKNNEISAVRVEEKTAYSQALKKVVESEENKLSSYQLQSNTEETMCERLKRAEKGTKMLEQTSNNVPIVKSAVSSLDYSFICEKQTCERKEVMVKKKQHAKSPEDSPGVLSHTPDDVPEICSQSAALAHNTLKQQKGTQLNISEGEQTTDSDHTNSPPPDSEEVEPLLLDAEDGIILEQSQKSVSKHKENINSTEGLPKDIKPLLSSFENQDPEPIIRNVEEKKDSMTGNGEEEHIAGKPKVVSRRLQSAQGDKYVDSAQESLSKTNPSCQDDCNTSMHKNANTHIQEDKLSIKNNFAEISRTRSKSSRQSIALENKTSTGTDKFLEKFAKCTEQSEQKTGHLRNSPLIIDITTDDTEKEEKTDDSADEMMDEISGYQSEDIVNTEMMDEDQSSEAEETVDVETVEELSEKINIARLKATASYTLLSKQLYLVCDPSNKMMAKAPKQSESPNKKPKNAEEAFANYRQTHTANERRRRKEMRGLFEKLKATLKLDSLPKVSKCFILKQALEEIQGLTDQADKLTGQKKLLMRKQDTLIRKVSALSGKTQEVVLKKLEYIYAKQKAVEAQKKKQQLEEPLKIIETTETATETVQPPVENSPPSVTKEVKPVVLSNRRTKPLILSRKGSHIIGDTPSMALTNASLVMTTDGQVLAIKSPLVPGQVASLPSTLLQTELMSENDSNNRTVQQGITSVMIQLPSSAVPVQVKGILPASTVPIALSAVASSSASSVAEVAPELSSENEDSFMMPRIVNVTSLATKEATHLNLGVNKNPYLSLPGDSQTFQPSFLSQETTSLHSELKSQTSGKARNNTGTAQDFHEEDIIPQIVNVSTLKGSSASFATEFSIEEPVGSQTRAKLMDKKNDRQKSKDSSFQTLQQPKDSGLEMELQKVASLIHEPSLDTSDFMDIEENDDTDETLTSLLNEIAFLNQQLNDDASDISELPSFSLGSTENRREPTTAGSSPFQFGTVGGNLKDLSVIRGNSDSITPLLLHLDDDDLPDGNKNSEVVSSESESLKFMLSSKVKDQNPDLPAVNNAGNKKTVVSLSKPRNVSPPFLQMKTNLETGKTDMTWRPMPKLAPLGLKAANFLLDSEGQNIKAMPSLAHVPSKEIKTSQPVTSPSPDPKAMLTLPLVPKKSK
ncbi:MAX gene-associated protein isoform X1 [Pogona vitticeps]